MASLAFCLPLTFMVFYLSTADAICPNGWTKYGEFCFALYEIPSTWTDAVSLCKEFGGHLATLNTTTKIGHAKDFVVYVKHNRRVWLGGSSLLAPGLFSWDINQKLIVNGDWSRGEPDGGNERQCLVMDPHDHFTWHDHRCNDHCDLLCETRSVPQRPK